METSNLEHYKILAREYLSNKSIGILRELGRELQLTRPCIMKKEPLIEAILAVSSGEATQERNARGAPIKNHFHNHEILDYLNLLHQKCFEKKMPTTMDTVPLALEKSPINAPTKDTPMLIRLSPKQKKLLHELIDTF